MKTFRKSWLKWSLALVLSFGVILIGIILEGQLWQEAQKHEEKLLYFHQALDQDVATHSIVEFTDDLPLGQIPSEGDEFSIGLGFTQSWQGFSKAVATGNPDHLITRFTGTAMMRAEYATAAEPQSRMVFMGMTAKPAVFHHDRSIIAMTADDAIFARFRYDKETFTDYRLSQDCVRDVLFLKVTGWAISNHELECSRDITPKPREKTVNFPKLIGINYYPKNTPWTAFWRDYSPWETERDLLIMRDLGANSVRIFIPFNAVLEPEEGDELIQNLDDFLKRAASHDLWVIPTLFDQRGELTEWSWSNDRAYLNKVLPVLNAYENIAYIDLKNEMDLDVQYHGTACAEAWARTMIGIIRMMSEHPISIGWSDAENALWLNELVDVVSYHDYGDMPTTQARYNGLKSRIQKPIVVSEIGATSYELKWSQPSNPQKQAEELSTRLNALQDADGVLVWTLYDYEWLDPEAVSGSFWHKGIQRHFGIFDRHRHEKPVVKIFRDYVANTTKDTP